MLFSLYLFYVEPCQSENNLFCFQQRFGNSARWNLKNLSCLSMKVLLIHHQRFYSILMFLFCSIHTTDSHVSTYFPFENVIGYQFILATRLSTIFLIFTLIFSTRTPLCSFWVDGRMLHSVTPTHPRLACWWMMSLHFATHLPLLVWSVRVKCTAWCGQLIG